MLNNIEPGRGAVHEQHDPGALSPTWEARNVNGHLPRAGKTVSRLGSLVVTGQGVKFRYGIGQRDLLDMAGHTIVSVGVKRRLLGTWLALQTTDGQSFRFRLKPAAAHHALTLLRTPRA